MTKTKWLLRGLTLPTALALAGGIAVSCADTGTAPESDGEPVAAAAGALAPVNGEVCVKLSRANTTVEDAWIEAAYAQQNVNHGSDTLTTGGLTVGKALFKFDVGSIPSNASVTRGFIRLNQTYNGNATLDAHLVTAPWSEGTVTHASFANAFTATPFGSVVFGPGPLPTIFFDMVSPLQGWISGAVPNHGILVDQGLEGQRIFRSSEDATAALRPTLEFCYQCPPGTTGANCAVNTDECSPNPCQNGGTCVDGVNSYTCQCPSGWTGTNCTVCPSGFGDCDGNAANACETALSANSTNCGACGIVCGTGLVCTGGACVPSCNNTNTTANCGSCGNACGVGQACTNGVCVNTACTPPAPCSGPGCVACTDVLYTEDWESGSGGWYSVAGGPVVVASEAAPCNGHFVRETVLYSGGRTFTTQSIPVVGGQTYCMSSWVRSGVGTQPFLGIEHSNAQGARGTEHWLIGNCGYPNGYGGSVSPLTPDGVWRWYSDQFTMSAGVSHVILKIEIFSAGLPGAADFDDIQLIEGPCPAAPPTICTAATCP